MLILAPLFFMINSPVTGVVITQVPVPVTTNFAVLQDAEQISVPAVQSGKRGLARRPARLRERIISSRSGR